MAESVGLAFLVVLERPTPAERVAFVLHDLFAVPFAEIATVVGRSPVASKKLASRTLPTWRHIGVNRLPRTPICLHAGARSALAVRRR